MRRMRTKTKGGSCGGTCPIQMGGKRSTRRNTKHNKRSLRRVTRKHKTMRRRKGGACPCSAAPKQPLAF
jgi:hypothetical protein